MKTKTKEKTFKFSDIIKSDIKVLIITLITSVGILFLTFLIQRNIELGIFLDSIMGIIGVFCYIAIITSIAEIAKNLWYLIRFPKMKKASKQFF